MIRTAPLATLIVATSTLSAFAGDPPKLELKGGDRVVYLGNAFAERDAQYGYFETLLTIAHPEIAFTFRNLGWSGDTVWGDARARFGRREDGFRHLKDHVLALKPTVILVAYEMNESFAGEAGLSEFEAGLNTLLDTLAETGARIVLISPIPIENLGPPMPDPSRRNADLKRYCDAIAAIAGRRGIASIDLFTRAADSPASTTPRLTDDGLHPVGAGSHRIAHRMMLESLARMPDREVKLEIGPDGSVTGPGVRGSEESPRGYKFVLARHHLAPPVSAVGDAVIGGSDLLFGGLPAGKFLLTIDGVPCEGLESTNSRPAICHVAHGPEIDQVEKLRAAINRKNELYFHRWRPQNETYLFGFRKHEQGNNAAEIPLFDPLVAEQEAEIARLRVARFRILMRSFVKEEGR